MKFTAYGHENVLSEHPRTLEFTKDKHLTKRGDCIVAVNANYEISDIKKLNLTDGDKIKIIIKCKTADDKENIVEDCIEAEYNNGFTNNHEMVVRITNFKDQRTFAINANKSSLQLKRKMIDFLKNPKNKIEVEIEKIR